jgi:hypothetical protein
VTSDPPSPPPKKMGRPARAGEAANKMVTIRLTDAEETAWLELAGETPLRVWARDLVNAHVARQQRKKR